MTHGLNLTRHFGEYRDTHQEMGYEAETGSITKVKSKGKSATITPGAAYVVRRIPGNYWNQYTEEYIADCFDERAGAWHTGWSDGIRPISSRPCKTISGAVGSLKRKIAEALFGWRAKEHPDIVAIEKDWVASESKIPIVNALKAAVHVHRIEGRDWGMHHEEITFSGGRFDVVVAQGTHIHAYEIKSCRSDFSSDKKWQKYLAYCDCFSFVTVPHAITLADLPEGIGLYWLNPDYIEKGSIPRRLPKQMALTCLRSSALSRMEDKQRLEIASSIINRGGNLCLQGVEGKLTRCLSEIKHRLVAL